MSAKSTRSRSTLASRSGGFLSISARLIAAVVFLIALISAPVLAEDAAFEESYRLGPGDHVLIRVYGEEDLTVDIRLNAKGVVSYPFLGEIQIGGKTSAEVEQLIVEGLKPDYLVSPVVNVAILEYREFYIYGEVKSPGEYQFEPGMTLRKAVALAGGFTERASRRNIVVVHENDPESKENKVALDERVLPGDVINVGQSFF